MKSLATVFFILVGLSFTNVIAQPSTSDKNYLFEEFQDGYVNYKDGRKFFVPLNYDLNEEQFVFVDKADGLKKEFSDPHLIATIQINERIFLLSQRKAKEIIQASPAFYVEYRGLTRTAPSAVTYDGSTQTASVDTYTSISATNITSGVKQHNRIIDDVYKVYEIEVGKKMKSFYNKRSFLKAFPKKFHDRLNKYIEEERVDFNSIDQVFQLYEYAVSLK